MFLQILQTGANILIVIVSLLLAFVAGLSTIDYLKSKGNGEEKS